MMLLSNRFLINSAFSMGYQAVGPGVAGSKLVVQV